jgi:hypothetical protein
VTIVNRAERADTIRVELPCRCPGQPHGSDSAQVVTLFGYGDRGDIRQAGRESGPEAFRQVMLARGVFSWTLTLPDGKPRPITLEEVRLLDEGTVDHLVLALDDAWEESPIPKGFGAPSRAGTRAKGGRTRKTTTPEPSTTR